MIKKRRKRKKLPGNPPDFLVITGLSGSGLSSATNALEDLGYFCVDNLPITMLPIFARLLLPDANENTAIEKAALVINIRERHFLSEFPMEIDRLAKENLVAYVIFFEASDEVLQRRFSETRRPHPETGGRSLMDSIRRERKKLEPIRKLADLIIDTSDHTVHTLRRFLLERFGETPEGTPLKITILSFGHKFGNPRDLDLLFDVRHLPNPFFEPKLKELPGSDPKVVRFLKKFDEVKETIGRFEDLIDYLLPFYKREGKSYLTIGVACTGGKHRSVMVANTLKSHLQREGYSASVIHRDVQK